MRIAPAVISSINNNRQNPQNTAFGYGVSINIKLPKKSGRVHGDGIKRFLVRVQDVLTGLKGEYLAIIEKIKNDTQVSEDFMHTIGIKIHAKQNLVPEVMVEVKGIEDNNPIIVSDLSMLDGKRGQEKLLQIKVAVETKARQSAALAKQAESAECAIQTAGTLVATA